MSETPSAKDHEQSDTNPPAKSPAKRTHSTAHYRVDVNRAEILASNFPQLTEVEIRECLEGSPLKQAVGLINWAVRCNPLKPYKPLKNWAKLHEKGFYSPDIRRLDSTEHYRRCMNYIRRKDEEKLATSGRRLLQRERVDLAQNYYAPGYRAEMHLASLGSPVAA